MKDPLKPAAQSICLFLLAGLFTTIHSGCTSETQAGMHAIAAVVNPVVPGPSGLPVADAATILKRTEVPILCYHQIRDFRPTDGKIG